MPKASRSISINAPLKIVYDVVTDFEAYPDIFPEVKAARVVRQSQKAAEVDFIFHVLTDIRCLLKFNLTPHKVSWKLIKGDFMTDNVGAWDLVTTGHSTRASYTVDITPTRWVPTSILEHLIENNAPHMLKSLKKKCEGMVKAKAKPKKKVKARGSRAG